MDAFEQYMDSLPRPTSPRDFGILNTQMLPYIIGESIDNKVHHECETASPTKTLTVYVPSQGESIEWNVYHYGLEDTQMCNDLRQRRLERDYPELAEIFRDFKNPLDGVEPAKRLELIARVQKPIREINNLTPRLVELSNEIFARLGRK